MSSDTPAQQPTGALSYSEVSPLTCTINGHRYRAGEAAWEGLDMDKAELRGASIWGEDHHLRVPWHHPADGPHPDPPECWYLVRPRLSSRRFVHIGNAWRLVHG